MKSQQNFHTREEIYQLVEEIYRALETTEERLDGRCDDIYFRMDLNISALTSKIEAVQGELVEIQSYIARRPEASTSIDKGNNKSTDIHHRTSVDDATNQGRLVQKMTSDMSDTHYHGEGISVDTYATLRRHQLDLESLEERLQRMENTTATMKEKWRRGDEAMRDFTGFVCMRSDSSNKSGRRVLERASRDEPSYICLPEHANLFTQTKLVPEIYTKDEINEMFYGVCGEQENNKEAFQMKLDGVYYPLNDNISWLTTCMEEMNQDIARIQNATDVARSSSIDRDQHTSINIRQRTSIDNLMPTSVDNDPPRPHTMKSQQNFYTREEIDKLVEEIYRALETTEERLDGRYDDIYFPMDLNISALTSKIQAMQGELVEIQSYIARRPEASTSIDRGNNISTDIHHRTLVDDATNLGRLVPKMTSDMPDTHYHGEEISADTYATLKRHQFDLESLEERLQRMENTTATMKEKWRRGDEAMRDFTDSTKDIKVDQHVNYSHLLRLFEGTKADLQH
ncbi:hypothetical protein DY000_02015860 [Brassica cretica]|uniref:Uncharacterized protein n=1 Tax=Brassica cretica TaxID=69181 RepID=A0ABQ7D8S6_BRACR|nr:hypothetical protein DY000_02015860 [Brassica cretica]